MLLNAKKNDLLYDIEESVQKRNEAKMDKMQNTPWNWYYVCDWEGSSRIAPDKRKKVILNMQKGRQCLMRSVQISARCYAFLLDRDRCIRLAISGRSAARRLWYKS